MSASLYDSDRFHWLEQQTALLKAGRFAEIDVTNLVGELESEVGNERRELYRRLRVLIAHLLKWQYQPEQRCSSWRGTIRIQRDEIQRLFKGSPSLRRFLAMEMAEVYQEALELAEDETGLTEGIMPKQCPYSTDEVMAKDFWP